ncbi:hypothetical protein F0562_004959 [Nyssa sinensis]|uniref:Bidirectional sugar transporter SWEET n=1 Tax=Nyssa sinensis TaxID=561372 RepID=A0A5J5AI41_9ASTE|nr:hypothetical protein F0562_004959 [Nyssa sinensis]
MVTAETARTAVGVVGNVISLCMFASPMPTFWRIIKNKSVEDFSPDPYIATVMNCLFWIFYGLPVVHPDSTLVITINGVGLGLELIYLSIFFTFTNNMKRLKIILWLCAELVFICIIAVITLLAFHTHERRSMFVGIFCVVFGVFMYASPLTIMKKVVVNKSVEYMPFWLPLANFLNGSMWLAYALIKFDLYITIGNGLGAICGAVQLILYACYYRSTPKVDDEKPSELQLPTSASPKSSA